MTSNTSRNRAGVILIGLGATAASALESLLERFDLLVLVRAPQPNGQSDDQLLQRARSAGVRVSDETGLRAIHDLVAELHPDCVVVSSYDRTLPPGLLALSRFINVHYSLLPSYRGRANVNWALVNGEPYTGVTIHTIAPGLDAGNILFQQAVPILATDTVADLYQRLNEIQLHALGDAVQRMLDGATGSPQNEDKASYGCTRLPRDGEIDWAAATVQIDRLVRALVNPFPGAFTYLEGRRLRVWRTEPVAGAPRYDGRIPGRVVRVSKDCGWVDVLTGDGVIRLVEVQLEHARRRAASEVITSVRTTLGLSAADLLRRIERLEREKTSIGAAGALASALASGAATSNGRERETTREYV